MGLDSKLIHNLVKQAAGILNAMAATVIHRTKVSQDGYGEIQWSDGVSLKAFLSMEQKKVVLMDGREVTSGFQLTIPQSVAISVNDRIEMPDGTAPPILKVTSPLDSSGLGYMTEVFF